MIWAFLQVIIALVISIVYRTGVRVLISSLLARGKMGLVIELRVVPSSGKSECVLDRKGDIKCFLKSAPEQGKANAELVKLIAKIAKVRSQDVTIIKGVTQRKKTVQITTSLTRDLFYARVSGDVQQKLF